MKKTILKKNIILGHYPRNDGNGYKTKPKQRRMKKLDKLIVETSASAKYLNEIYGSADLKFKNFTNNIVKVLIKGHTFLIPFNMNKDECLSKSLLVFLDNVNKDYKLKF